MGLAATKTLAYLVDNYALKIKVKKNYALARIKQISS
jgi:hypothetical protein